MRWPLNTRINGGDARAMRICTLNPANPTMNMSIGERTFDGINFGVRRRMDQRHPAERVVLAGRRRGPRRARRRRADHQPGAGLDRPAAPTCSRARRRAPTRATRSRSARSSRRRGASPCRRSSAIARRCRCTSGTATTTTSTASATTSTRRPTSSRASTMPANPSFKEMGACETVNCGRGAPLSQFNLRVSKVFRSAGRHAHRGVRRGVQHVQRDQPGVQRRRGRRRRRSSPARWRTTRANTVFMKPNAYAGDNGQPEQRVGQIGFRITF